MLYRLQNPIQNYAWGSTSALTELFGIPNEKQEPQAEMWMGVHPNGCSEVLEEGRLLKLSELIARNPQEVLGKRMYLAFGELPYLLKILCADKPLSIQVHPEKNKAVAGYVRENRLGLNVSAGNRNYRDPNHKPELVYALTHYKAMNAFRPMMTTVALFEQSGCEVLTGQVAALKANPTSEQLQTFFRFVLSLQGEQKASALAQLLRNIDHKGMDDNARLAFATAADLAREYPDDMGVFAPLYLNVIELQPGEAMFLHAETPHAYLEGVGVEIMANSDNVLRAGLTPKHMDIDELIANTRFVPVEETRLLTSPVFDGVACRFPVPVDDFKFEILTLNAAVESARQHEQAVFDAEILLCIAGEITVAAGGETLLLRAGESAFVDARTAQYALQGSGQLARISS